MPSLQTSSGQPTSFDGASAPPPSGFSALRMQHPAPPLHARSLDGTKVYGRSDEMSEEQPSPLSQRGSGPNMARGWSLTTFRQGVDAAKAGQPSSANPYREGSDQAAIWLGGWQVGASM